MILVLSSQVVESGSLPRIVERVRSEEIQGVKRYKAEREVRFPVPIDP